MIEGFTETYTKEGTFIELRTYDQRKFAQGYKLLTAINQEKRIIPDEYPIQEEQGELKKGITGSVTFREGKGPYVEHLRFASELFDISKENGGSYAIDFKDGLSLYLDSGDLLLRLKIRVFIEDLVTFEIEGRISDNFPDSQNVISKLRDIMIE